jgi:PleD family two-component response regulator
LRALVASMRVETPQGELKITASLGCATATANQDLLRVADEALYAAKRNGRDIVCTVGEAAAAA